VGSSRAVKTAYDKGVEAKNAADNAKNAADAAQRSANSKQSPATTLAGYGITNAVAIVANSGYKLANNKIEFGWKTDAPYGLGLMVDNRFQGVLVTREMLSSAVDSDETFTPASVAGVKRAFGEAEKRVLYTSGKRYAEVFAQDGSYAGFQITRTGTNGSWITRIESSGDKRIKFHIQNSHDVYIPARGGTVLLDTDFNNQKIGDFEIRKYPDGTMIQTYRFTPPNERVNVRGMEFLFNWALAFREKPKIFAQNINLEHNGYGSLDTWINISDTKTTNSQVAFWVLEDYLNGNLVKFDFLAIGRWK
ncbi:hypothetical protein ACWIUA_12260, partial [Ursidibacter sp. B-7004-1]